MIPGMAADLARRLGIETELIDPFRRIVCERGAIDPQMAGRIGPMAAVGVGLALRKIGDK
jgi:type IV pilus assembly protein PilM